VLYAGKSADLRGRLVQHLQTRSTSKDVLVARRAADLHFSAAPVLDGGLRGGVEAALIMSLRPPFNRQCPRPTSGLSVTLPPLAISFNW
jgi:excinuclease UvrABC nuclease subunit